MKDIEKLIRDETEGNKGRRAWLITSKTAVYAYPVNKAEIETMLEGACNTIDKLLEALRTAYSDGIRVGVLAETEARSRQAEMRVEITNFHKGDNNG